MLSKFKTTNLTSGFLSGIHIRLGEEQHNLKLKNFVGNIQINSFPSFSSCIFIPLLFVLL